MADTPDDNTSDTEEQPSIQAIEQQIASLRREIKKLGRALADFGEEEIATQVETVGGVVRNNPGTFSGALFLGTALGVVIGLALGTLNEHSYRWR